MNKDTSKQCPVCHKYMADHNMYCSRECMIKDEERYDY